MKKNVIDFKLAYMKRQLDFHHARGDIAEYEILYELIDAYTQGIVDVNITDGELFFRVDDDNPAPEDALFVPVHVEEEG